MDRIEKAIENHKKGCNCAQAVALAYTDILEIEEELIYRLTEGYGSGIGGLREICGAVNAGVLVLSASNSDGKVFERGNRQDTYQKVKEYMEAFKEVDGTYQCGELLALRKEKKSHFLSCTDCVQKAAELLEEYLSLHK